MNAPSRLVDLASLSRADAAGDTATWTTQFHVVDRDLLLCENAAPFLREAPAIAEAEDGGFGASTVVGEDAREYVDGGHRTSRRIVLATSQSERLRRLGVEVLALEEAFLAAYLHHVNPRALRLPGKPSGRELLRYEVGQFFGEHVDAVRGNGPLASRLLATVGFCNDDYEGGELVFPRQGLVLRPPAGSILIFPALMTHPHSVRPVTKGVRYTIVGWYE